MSAVPEYVGVDIRKPVPKQVTVDGAVKNFYDERPAGTVAVNLGCGQSRLDGFVNVDWMPDDAVDVACDLFAPNWPIADDSVGFVFMSHLLEHVPPTAWATFWNEVYRICANGARVMVIGPHARSDRFLGDPTHCQPLVDRKFLYLNKKWRTQCGLNHGYYGSKELNFIMDIAPWRIFNQDFAMREDSVKHWEGLHSNNVIDDQIWFVKCFKDDASQDAYVTKMDQAASAGLIAGTPVGD